MSARPVPVTVTITSVECTQEDECDAAGIEAAGQSWPDFYARVFINGVQTDTPRADDDQQKIQPFWTVTGVVDDSVASTVPIAIQIWDHDSTSGDDIADSSPRYDHNNLDLVLDLATGRWSGDTTTSCATGDGVDTDDDDYYPVRVCFDISTLSASGDADGDGLLDSWESFGFDADGDGTIDVNLPAMGANPQHQDIFLELDYETGREPTRDGINAMKRAFAVAPRLNPDGTTGINLHVDAGALFDAGADEAGRVATCTNGIDDDGDGVTDGQDDSCFYLDASREVGVGDCGNGVDDDGDGLVDASDPQCLVGDNLGGGNALVIAPATRACGLDGNFATIKASQFNANRAWIFHYALQAAAPPDPPPPAPPLRCAGGEGEVGGNDFISHNLGAGTLMHELGHNLNLEHGGSNSMNCKPNYLSVMNYNLQAGIPQVTGGRVLDYSPPRTALNGSTRAGAPLATLLENGLNEALAVDPADANNSIVFMNGQNQLATVGANTLPDWTGDPSLPTGAGVNIDNGIPATATAPGVGAPGCANTALNSVLVGDNDWNRVALNFHQFAAGASGAIVRNPETSPTQDDLDRMQQEMRRTDLQLTLTATPDPVAAGEAVTYTAVIVNRGPNPSLATSLDLEVPPATALFLSPPPGCVAPASEKLSCDIDMLRPGETRTITAPAMLPADLVYLAGAPFTIDAVGKVADRAGNDAAQANNTSTATVKAVAVADLAIRLFDIPNPPRQMLPGEAVVIELASTLHSGGPSSPMDTLLTLRSTADNGATVTPTFLTTTQAALRQDEVRTIVDHAVLTCREPGHHRFRFEHQIAPDRAPDSDPVAGNDKAVHDLAIECLHGDQQPPQVFEQPEVLLRGLRAAGLDSSVAESDLLSWLSTQPPSTAYPAIITSIIQNGWRFRQPAFIDVIVWNYEHSPGITSPRLPTDVDTEVLKRAILAASNERNGTTIEDFNALLQ
ncbi:DUF11 domain-containing protein [Haematobacter massiliensis]|uniref:DUF11 domain-containing protein n=1 Tax=Haematobacter massiliensis TaxID=195105 RepID=UPI00103C26F7|nr:DUF11 domain-containing protein [Haematobacter massiliensis]QBJ25608.1 hypothetical protein HmaOT1_14790 [Haematobacter massiliensis]